MSVKVDKIDNYTAYIITPLKLVACWDWYRNPKCEYQIIINHVYCSMVLFVLTNLPVTLMLNLCIGWSNTMESLENIADGLPVIVSLAIVVYFSVRKQEMYDLVDYMNENFVYRSVRGTTVMSMDGSCSHARKFAYVYTVCTLFSVTMYVMMPIIIHLWTKQPLQNWVYEDADVSPYFEIIFVRQCLVQAFVGLAIGQLGVFFASNSILLCGQLDLLCFSLKNARFAAALVCGSGHEDVATSHPNMAVNGDETNSCSYSYNKAVAHDTDRHRPRHYDGVMAQTRLNRGLQLDRHERDAATNSALRACARVQQVASEYRRRFEAFVSPLLALRVVQVTLYLCVLLYSASSKLDMATIEYLMAVVLDIFIYCYYGNQIIIQSARVSAAAYHSGWHGMGSRSRRTLLNILLASQAPSKVRASRYLPMDLNTFLTIVKTSFSYYTLLVNVNNK